jgi:hypothetical protein
VYVDATYNTSKGNNHLYAIVTEELGYGVPVGFMLMEMGPWENYKASKTYTPEASICNKNFFSKARELGLNPRFFHCDRGWSEINPSQVLSEPCTRGRVMAMIDEFFDSCGVHM